MQHQSSNPPGGGSEGQPPDPGGDEGRRSTDPSDEVAWPDLGDDGLAQLSPDLVARILRDIGLGDRKPSPTEELLAQLPAVEPDVRNMYGEYHKLSPIGYSETPMNRVVVPLCRKKYPEFADAQTRLQELLALRNLRVVGQPFYDVRNWCWHCVPA